nr:Gag-Pol polyprotein [Tanacetum cinerariifolium]
MENYKNVSQDIHDQLNAEAEAVYIILKGIHNDIYSTIEACPNACEMWKAIESLKQGESIKTYKNVSQEIRDQLNAEAEAIQIILTGIDNDIYSTVDACPNACEMWKAIERLKQGKSINVQDLETNLYWEFRKFTSHDEWQRFVTLVKLNQELKTVSYHKLYDILKQHQHEVNEITAERIVRVANPLALIAQQQPVYHPQTHHTHYTQNSSTISQQAATRNREKAIVNSPQPIYDQEPSMRAKDAAFHREKMLLSKQEEAGIQLNAEQADWRDETDDDELEDQELEA